MPPIKEVEVKARESDAEFAKNEGKFEWANFNNLKNKI